MSHFEYRRGTHKTDWEELITRETPTGDGRRTVMSLQWRQNEHDGVSNHRRLDCLPNRLLSRRAKKMKENIKAARHWPLLGDGKFPSFEG